ncbi:1-acyl-sn-glycerol-3-phosphate acyltransferase [Uruburuella testudinis]|uniref:1-acyl-sn-glycerol-3-phosphate acyltransferase n=1 Tax=Uruburuella testudinis TaxID=1282863 RepID=A0ABY4DUA9_9NEIS|nr:lysophospholipid acyltransferase family protein [Uruburuella testudinis]UOO82260.1 1-acyl-sn-glycerol-3-phosphate acyltransferase [Uruburuella testudinis]
MNESKISLLRLPVRLLCIGWHVAGGVLQMAFLFRFLSPAQKRDRIQAWSQRLLSICGVALQVRGLPPLPCAGGNLLVANHVSWLDIFALNAVMPNRFVAKAEVARWPLVGYLARQTGTLFVARERSGSTQAKVAQAAAILQSGDNLVLFPEGTTSMGDRLLPFKSSFFQAALDRRSAVWPLLCRYVDGGGCLNPNMAYCGDTSLWQSLCLILRQRQGSLVVLDFLPPVPAQGSRRELAEKVYARMADKLAEPVCLVQTTYTATAQEWARAS